MYKPVKSIMVLCCLLGSVLVFLSGCSEKPAPPPAKTVKPASTAGTAAPVPQPADEALETGEQEGYVYERRDRRDPFVPLIVPKISTLKGEGPRAGTLESYDISEFTLAAIAHRGTEFFALITTPDNRSFTVSKGTTVGMNRGKVKDITKDALVIVEYTKDFRGEIKPRQIILEFHKGEVE
ncbi:MAG: pilus assembly protein PilP [Nitrospiraceae bacterium]|nr:MAG: pilus assembly protein PilP [Nitrospiraceae bacterium]